MDAKSLKTFLASDPQRIEKVLENYGFEQFWTTNNEVRCAPPGSNNKTACSIKITEELYSSSYHGEGFHGDLFGLLQYTSKKTFSEILRDIKGMFGISGTSVTNKHIDLFAGVNKYLREGGAEYENKKFNKSILNKFIHMPHESFIAEGIAPDVLKMFDICFDVNKDRIVIPHYDWGEHDKVVGIVGRTTLESAVAKMVDVPKYWNYIKGYHKTNNLFGWNHSSKYLAEKKMLIIFEAEKSVMKQFTRVSDRHGYSVSIGGHEISESQVNFIIANTTADTEIVIAMDKDVMTMKDDDGNLIGEQHIKDMCSGFIGFRKVSYIWDEFNLLGEKDSPIDRLVKVWNVLLKYRKEVT